MSQILISFSEVAKQYDAVFCDVWGVVHNGVTPHAEAVAALQAFREGGGTVILVTNSPQPRSGVEAQLERIGVPESAWDAIATSGDSARAAMYLGVVGERIIHLGPQHDKAFFDAMALIQDPVSIEIVDDVRDADGIVCTGPEAAHDGPEQYETLLRHAKQRGLKLLCANPDIVVDRGETREYCAGAVAKYYTELGGESLYFGKPHPPIYDLARRRLAALDASTDDSRILAIGDGPATDLAGGIAENLDTLFVAGGLERAELVKHGQVDPEALQQFLARQQLSVTYTMATLC